MPRAEAILHIDLRPDLTAAALTAKLGAARGKQSLSTFLRKTAGLAPVAISLLHEAQSDGARLGTLPPEALATLIKAVPVRLAGVADIAKAISTAGGVAFDAIDPQFMLRKQPGTFVAGEMLDWEAPTGGYLLQACFATGVAAGQGALAWSQSEIELIDARSRLSSPRKRGTQPRCKELLDSRLRGNERRKEPIRQEKC